MAVFAGLIQPATAAPQPVQAAAVSVAADEPTVPRPMPEDLYKEWNGRDGVDLTGDPRLRQLVADIAELDEDVEVREAATAALAGDDTAIMTYLNSGYDAARAQANARKQETARQNRAAIEPLRGTGGPLFNAEVIRVLAGTDGDRADFVAFGGEIAKQRDAQNVQNSQALADLNRSRVQMLVGAGGPEVQKAAQVALNAGDVAITNFLKTGYLVAARADADAREAYLKDLEDRNKAAEALTDLAQKAARAALARKNLLIDHGNGVRALQRVSNALVSAGTEARKAEQILAANNAGGQHPLSAFDGVKAEVARQLGYASQAATEAQQASAAAQVEANILVDTGLTYGVQWAQMAIGMASASSAAVKAAETAQHAIDATAATDQARSAQEKAEAHAEEATQWRLHAEEHARAAASIAEAARIQAVAAQDAAARTKVARQAAEAAEAQAWAAAQRTRDARLTAEAEAQKAAAARAVAERERANAAAARARADQQAAVARTARGQAELQAGIAASARARAEAQDGVAALAEDGARAAERDSASSRDRAFAAERSAQAMQARAAAIDAAAASARGTENETVARDAAAAARGDADTATNAAGAARGAANTATGAAAGARAAATDASRAAARARAAAQEAAAAAARANAAANQAEAEAAATHAAALQADAAAAEATTAETQASEAASAATRLAEQAASEAIQSLWAAERTKAEADAAVAESVSAATQANISIQASMAARASAQAITDPANTAITVAAPFTGADLDADFVVLVANQAKAVGAAQAQAAQDRAAEAVVAAQQAAAAAARATGEVKPAFDAAAAAAASSAAAARSAADAQTAAAAAAIDGAAARAAGDRANQADAQAHADAVLARKAANAAGNDAAIAGRSASAAEHDAAAARASATAAENDAAAARGAATAAENDAAAARTAADSAQVHADNAAEAAKNALANAVAAGQAADRAEAAARAAEVERRKQQVEQSDAGDPGLSADEEEEFLKNMSPEAIAEYRQAADDAKKGVIDYILENGGQALLDVIGYTDANQCFSESDVAACLWTVVNVGSLLTLITKLPAVSSAIAKVASGLVKFLEGSQAGKQMLELVRDFTATFKRITLSCPIPNAAGKVMATAAGADECLLKPLGRGSTGDTVAQSLKEKLAMDEAMSNPSAGREITNIILKDERWPATEGWIKMKNNVNGVEIHYVMNKITGHVDDYKFKR